MAGEAKDPGVQAHLVSKIVASYVAHHTVPPEQIPVLIGTIHRTFSQLGRPAEQPAPPTPAVPVRRSVQRDAVTCLDCGWKGKMLRRHLNTRHGLSGEEYLRRWNLSSDHPLTAPMYSQQRSTLAKELGLGRNRAEGEAAPAPRRGRPRKTP
jgi:predicted transcriptional regulator